LVKGCQPSNHMIINVFNSIIPVVLVKDYRYNFVG